MKISPYTVYTENGSKNCSGSLALLRVENKAVLSYATPEAGIRCHAKLLDMYLSKIPPEAKKKDVFYLHPVAKKPTDPVAPWYHTGRRCLGRWCQICARRQAFQKGQTIIFACHGSDRDVSIQDSWEGYTKQDRALVTMYEKVSEKQQKSTCKVLTTLENKPFAGGPMPSVPVPSSISASPGVVPYNSAPLFR